MADARHNRRDRSDPAAEPERRSSTGAPPAVSEDRFIRIVGAREHNLQDVDLDLPKNRLICFTGVSGSGKSSLAFDTIYAEGQRRYIESLSSYARQFMGQLPKPDVEKITGLAPSISIQQKTSGWNPRSTVGTITQIQDYLRVLFARAGVGHCTRCGRPISAQTREQMVAQICALPAGTRFLLLAPKVRAQKGEYRDLFEDLLRRGYIRARVDGQVIDLADPPALDRYRRHDIEVVIDRLIMRDGARARVAEALDAALMAGDGTAIVAVVAGDPGTPESAPEVAESSSGGAEPLAASRRGRRGRGQRGRPAAGDRELLLSSGYACTACQLSFEPPNPQMFSFNSPQGMCPVCDGLGTRFDFDPDLLVPDPTLDFLAPCIVALRHKPGRWRRHIYQGVADHVGFDLGTPWEDLPDKARHALLYGTGDEHLSFTWRSRHGPWKHGGTFEGVVAELQIRHKKAKSAMVRGFYEQFMRQTICPRCRGSRLNEQALAVRLESRVRADGPASNLNIQEASALSIQEARAFFEHLQLEGSRKLIAEEPLKEIRARLQFLIDVGLEYLSLERAAPTLSGGESQRIRLASQIGCGLVGILYVLDEPSIGLHPRDNKRLLATLQRLRDMGNTVVVVEHDRDTMEAADLIVDFGPGPGVRGGRVVGAGSLEAIATAVDSLTGAYLSGRAAIEVPRQRRPVERTKVNRVRGRRAGRPQSEGTR